MQDDISQLENEIEQLTRRINSHNADKTAARIKLSALTRQNIVLRTRIILVAIGLFIRLPYIVSNRLYTTGIIVIFSLVVIVMSVFSLQEFMGIGLTQFLLAVVVSLKLSALLISLLWGMSAYESNKVLEDISYLAKCRIIENKNKAIALHSECQRLDGIVAPLEAQLSIKDKSLTILREKACEERRRSLLRNQNWREMRGIEFEQFLVKVFIELGEDASLTSKSNDQGVDILIRRKNELIAIQVKGYNNSVGNSAIQEVHAGKTFYGCHKSVVITNSKFTKSATKLARSLNCLLIDGSQIDALIGGAIRI